MPAKVRKREGRYRVVEPNGRLVRSSQGKPADGGGFNTKRNASAQARAINASK